MRADSEGKSKSSNVTDTTNGETNTLLSPTCATELPKGTRMAGAAGSKDTERLTVKAKWPQGNLQSGGTGVMSATTRKGRYILIGAGGESHTTTRPYKQPPPRHLIRLLITYQLLSSDLYSTSKPHLLYQLTRS